MRLRLQVAAASLCQVDGYGSQDKLAFLGTAAKALAKSLPKAIPSVATRVPPVVKPLASAVIRPAVRPRPALVAAAKPAAAVNGGVSRLLAGLGKTRDTIANVPRGENFLQRPLSNTKRLLTLDGVPGMRNINRAAITAAGVQGANYVSGVNQEINKAVGDTTDWFANRLEMAPEQRQQLGSDLQSIKWPLIKDQTIGRLSRAVFGGSPREQRQDAIIGGVTAEALRRNLWSPTVEEQSTLPAMLANRTPVAAAMHQTPGVAAQLVGKPDGLGIVPRLAQIAAQPVADTTPTKLERELGTRLASTWGTLSASQQRKFMQDMQTAKARIANAPQP